MIPCEPNVLKMLMLFLCLTLIFYAGLEPSPMTSASRHLCVRHGKVELLLMLLLPTCPRFSPTCNRRKLFLIPTPFLDNSSR